MLKLLAQFFSTLAGTHKHDGITHKALEANKLIVAQQLESIAELKKDFDHPMRNSTSLFQLRSTQVTT